jgi:hypothetical protein
VWSEGGEGSDTEEVDAPEPSSGLRGSSADVSMLATALLDRREGRLGDAVSDVCGDIFLGFGGRWRNIVAEVLV